MIFLNKLYLCIEDFLSFKFRLKEMNKFSDVCEGFIIEVKFVNNGEYGIYEFFI